MAALAVVGVALKKEKRKKHISDKLVAQAAANGIELRFVDKEVPLEQQGPFVAILQKVRKPDWEQMLVEYAAAHPDVQVYDMPAATYPLRNRGTMVSFLDGDGWQFEEPPELVQPGRPPQRCRCNVPTNTTLAQGTGLAAALRQMQAAGLRFPVLAKPLWADGREGSHALAVVHTPAGLEQVVAGRAAYLQLPVMLQQYVDHGGCLFKVYVLGDTSVRVKRNSLHLPQWVLQHTAGTDHQQQQQQQAGPAAAAAAAASPGEQQQQQQGADAVQQGAAAAAAADPPHPSGLALAPDAGPLPDLELMERVSAYPATKSWGRADTAPKGHGVPSPPSWLLQALAQRLRRKTGLSLFNFDVIVPMHLHPRQPPHAASASGTPVASAAGEQRQQQQQQGPGPATNGSLPAAAQLGRRLEQAAAEAAAAVDGRPAAGAGGRDSLDGELPPGETGDGVEDEPVAIDLQAAHSAAAEAAAAAAAEACVGGGGGGGERPAGRGASEAAEAGEAWPASARAQEQTAVEQQQAAQQEADQGQQQGQQQAEQAQGELLYHLIDINYFPGYEKMPNYEEYMVQFLRSICFPPASPNARRSQQQQAAGLPPLPPQQQPAAGQ